MQPGEWVAVHGCGGLGLSAVMVAVTHGARVVAVDLSPAALELAAALGAEHLIGPGGDVVTRIVELTGGGAQLSLDTFGGQETCTHSIRCLRPRGRHVQVGLLPEDPVVPLGRVLSLELEVIGSHGLAAHTYPELLNLIADGRLQPERLVTRELSLDDAAQALEDVGRRPGIAVITTF